jgi:ankyrin repeat protein
LADEIKVVEQELAAQQQKVQMGLLPTDGTLPTQQKLLELKRQLEALEAGEAVSLPAERATTDEEAQEIIRIQQMIQNSPDLINAPGENQDTPLMKAASHGWLKVAAYLLDHGADVNADAINPGAGLHNATALSEAARAGNRAMVGLLLSRGADVNVKGLARNNPLNLAARNGFQAVVEVLLANHAKVNTQDENGSTPLSLAAANGRVKIVQMLLAAGADPNVETQNGRVPLSFAAASGSPEMVKLLLDAKTDPNGGKLDAPLFGAIEAKNPVIAERLLQAGANPNLHGNINWDVNINDRHYMGGSIEIPPLWFAVSRNQLPLVQLLLKFKADPDDAQTDGRTVLFDALSDTNILQALLAAGANPNVEDHDGRTLLSFAAESAPPESVKLLLAAKADPNGGKEDAPLICAIANQHSAAAELLLQAGANPNVDGRIGRTFKHPQREVDGAFFENPHDHTTPLFVAVCNQKLPLVQLLLKYKADPNDAQTDSRAMIFNALYATNVLQALLEAGANADARDATTAKYNNRSLNWTPLICAVKQSVEPNSPPAQSVEILLQHGANPNLTDDCFGKSALHWCAGWSDQLPHRTILEMLLDHKADPNLRDNGGRTLLDILKAMLKDAPADNQAHAALGFAPPPGTPRGSPLQTQSASANKQAALNSLADLLRQHGALDVLPDWNRITVSRPSDNRAWPVFSKQTNDWNQFTLFELVAVECHFLSATPMENGEKHSAEDFFGKGQPLPFPDLTQLRIHRPAPDQKTARDTTVDLGSGLKSGETLNDVPLQWGDVVEIPETDHPLHQVWPGFSDGELANLRKFLTRHIAILVNGQTNFITLAPEISLGGELITNVVSRGLGNDSVSFPQPRFSTSIKTATPFWLSPVLLQSKLILTSSDLAHIKVTRHEPGTGKTREWVVDCSGLSQNQLNTADFWLRDGDQIEVPEKP